MAESALLSMECYAGAKTLSSLLPSGPVCLVFIYREAQNDSQKTAAAEITHVWNYNHLDFESCLILPCA